MKLSDRLNKVFNHPTTNLGLGILLMLTGIAEIRQDFANEATLTLGAHHGVTVYGFVMIARTLSTLAEGFEHLSRKP